MLESRTFGRGPSHVVILHGAPTRPEHGDVLAQRLAARHSVHVVSLPGYGRSAPLETVSVEAVQDAIVAAIEPKAALVGFSAGAYHAFALATRCLVKATAIVSLGGFAFVSAEAAAQFRQFAALLRTDFDARDLMVARMLSEAGRASAANAAEVQSWLEATSRENLARELEAFAAAPDLRPEIAKLDVPIVVRAGTLDVASPPVVNEDIVRHCKRGTLELVDGKGHALLLEDLDGTVAAIERALS